MQVIATLEMGEDLRITDRPGRLGGEVEPAQPLTLFHETGTKHPLHASVDAFGQLRSGALQPDDAKVGIDGLVGLPRASPLAEAPSRELDDLQRPHGAAQVAGLDARGGVGIDAA